jgi:anti-anti-sigma factor
MLDITNNRARLTLAGRFTYDENELFKGVLDELEQAKPADVVIDLTRVDFIDSAGLGMFLLLRDKMPESTRITLSNASASIRKIFALTKLDSIFSVV